MFFDPDNLHLAGLSPRAKLQTLGELTEFCHCSLLHLEQDLRLAGAVLEELRDLAPLLGDDLGVEVARQAARVRAVGVQAGQLRRATRPRRLAPRIRQLRRADVTN